MATANTLGRTAAAAALLFASASQAALVNTNPGGEVVDFSQFAFCTSYGSGTVGCQSGTDVGALVGESIIFTAINVGDFDDRAELYNAGWGLVDNGSWNSDRNGYAGFNNQSQSADLNMTFTFANAVAAVGGLMNYGQPGAHPFIEALAYDGSVLESYDLSLVPITTPGGLNAGEFRGIERSAGDIFALRVRGGYVPVLDDLTFTPAVPEPSTYALLMFGLAAGVLIRRRRN